MNDSVNKIFEGLNPAQAEAVEHIEGPSLIIAGAGSGKTKVLTCRIANLLAHGIEPRQVLALTFTKKAAGEMKERIGAMVGERVAGRIVMGTFHSVFVRFLREFAEVLGYPQSFTIYDQSDSRSAVRQCIRELELDEKVYKPNEVQNRISLAKNNLLTPQGYKASSEVMQSDIQNRKGRICDIYELYCRKCRQAGAMDFDDLLMVTNILFRDFPDALETVRSRFRYIFVDEYQDTNYSQYLILKKLAAVHRNICVVGDDSQSIYGFRGAKIENILNFRKDYPDARLVRLERNYRSTSTIVEAANSLISKNRGRIPKECFSTAGPGERIGLLTAMTEQDEGFMIASDIVMKIYRDKAQYEDFVVLYRTNAQSRAIEDALRRRNLPYRIYAGHSFYDRAEVKDMMCYFRLVVNPRDDEAFRRVINVPARGIGDTSLGRLSEMASARGYSLFDTAGLTADELAAAGLRGATAAKFHEFTSIITELSSRAESTEAYELAVETANRSGYYLSLKADNSFEGQARLENIEELLNSVKEYCEDESDMRLQESEVKGDGSVAVTPGETAPVTLCDYLENVSLLSEVEKEDRQDGETNNRITLMTIHSSKGLEYPYVYVAGMEENLFPSQGADEREVEEERRLCYVAITRARKCVTMSHSRSRFKWGQHQSNPPSRFLREIDPQYFEADVPGGERAPKPAPSHGYAQRPVTAPRPHTAPSRPLTATPSPILGFVPDPVSMLSVGKRVEHDRFGAGTIITMEGSGVNQKAIVDFDASGRKTLLLKYAKLRLL